MPVHVESNGSKLFLCSNTGEVCADATEVMRLGEVRFAVDLMIDVKQCDKEVASMPRLCPVSRRAIRYAFEAGTR